MRTVVRSFGGVDPQVIEEVMPFSEHLLAIGMSACKESNDSSIVWVLVLVDHELVSGWHVLVDSHRV